MIDLNACLVSANLYDRVTGMDESLEQSKNCSGYLQELNIKHACLDDFVFFLLTIVVSEDSRQLCSISVLTLNFITIRQYHNVCL